MGKIRHMVSARYSRCKPLPSSMVLPSLYSSCTRSPLLWALIRIIARTTVRLGHNRLQTFTSAHGHLIVCRKGIERLVVRSQTSHNIKLNFHSLRGLSCTGTRMNLNTANYESVVRLVTRSIRKRHTWRNP